MTGWIMQLPERQYIQQKAPARLPKKEKHRVSPSLVEISGLEPELAEPKSVVLPLHHTPKYTPYIHIRGVRTTKIYNYALNYATKM